MRLWQKFVVVIIFIMLSMGGTFYYILYSQTQRSIDLTKKQNAQYIQLTRSSENAINALLHHWLQHVNTLADSEAMQAYISALQNHSLASHPNVKQNLEIQALSIQQMIQEPVFFNIIDTKGMEHFVSQQNNINLGDRLQLPADYFKQILHDSLQSQFYLPLGAAQNHLLIILKPLWFKNTLQGVLRGAFNINPVLNSLQRSIPVGVTNQFLLVSPQGHVLFGRPGQQSIINHLLKESPVFQKALHSAPIIQVDHRQHHVHGASAKESYINSFEIQDGFVSIVQIPLLQTNLVLLIQENLIASTAKAITLKITWVAILAIIITSIFSLIVLLHLNRTQVSKEYVDEIVKSVANMLFTLDANLIIQRSNDAASSVLGYKNDELIGTALERLIYDKKGNQKASLINMLNKEPVLNSEQELISKTGEKISVLFSSSIFHNKETKKLTIICISQNIVAQKKAERKLKHLANFDILTNIPNRANFLTNIKREFSKSVRYGSSFALLLLDINQFKAVNDRLGHPAGDLLLKKIAEKIQVSLRQGDFASRIGGDEFAMLLTPLDSHYISSSIANRIIDAIKSIKEISGRNLFVESSIGIALYDKSINNYEELIQNADVALYQAKEKAYSNYQYFSSAINDKYADHLSLEHDLHVAIENEEFYLLYQPKIDLKTKKIIGMEALIRWNRPGHGVVMPNDFIALAEETRFIIPIGIWVLETACKQYAQWYAETGDACGIISINVSPLQLTYEKGRNLLEEIKRIFRVTGVPASKVELEITETEVMTYLEDAVDILNALDDLGVMLSVDDFGTGYSALSNLKTLPISTIKIDKIFIDRVIKNKDDAEIIKSIIDLALKLNINIIAEGVETLDQVDFLIENGCPQAQGYYFSKPTTKENILKMIKEKDSPQEPSPP